jgi:hypothetical protein
MALFVVQHRHPPERCPAGDRQMAPMLLAHLADAPRHGLTIRGEAVIDGAHTLVLIVDAAERAQVEGFMQPFAQAGTVEVLPASPCEAVVQRATCDPA